jgi:hypothetical protein
MKTASILMLALLLLPFAAAWEEQLEGCRIRGIDAADCPDDESFVGVPFNPERVDEGSSRTAYTHSRWVVDKWLGNANSLCYWAHYQLIFEKKIGRQIVDFPSRTVYACTSTFPVINTVLLPTSVKL